MTKVGVVNNFEGEAQLIDKNTKEKYMLSDGSYAYYSLRIPKIDSNKSGAENLNNKIMKNYQSYIDIVKANGEVNSFKGLTTLKVNYEYNIEDSILYIAMKSEAGSSSSAFIVDPVYVYDIANDSELGIADVLSKKNADVNYVKNTLKERFEDSSNLGYGAQDYIATKNAIDSLSYDYFVISKITTNSITISALGYPIEVTVSIN